MRFNVPPNWPESSAWSPPPIWTREQPRPEAPCGWELGVAHDPTSGHELSVDTESVPLGRRTGRRSIWSDLAATVLVITAVAACTPEPRSVTPTTATSAQLSSPAPTAIDPSAARTQVTLPFPNDESFYPHDIAVDADGTVYVSDVNAGVLQLATARSTSERVPFDSVSFGVSTAVDGTGNVYLADDGNGGKGRIQKITTDGRQTELPIGGLGQDPNIAAGTDGTLYIADGSNDRVLRIDGSNAVPTELPLVGVNDPRFVAVNASDDIVVSDRANGRVLLLARGSTSQQALPFDADLRANGVAIDDAGNVYAAVPTGVDVYVAKTGTVSTIPTEGLQPYGVAVDKVGTVFVTDFEAHKVVALRRAG